MNEFNLNTDSLGDFLTAISQLDDVAPALKSFESTVNDSIIPVLKENHAIDLESSLSSLPEKIRDFIGKGIKIIFAFILFSSYNKIQARKFLEDYKKQLKDEGYCQDISGTNKNKCDYVFKLIESLLIFVNEGLISFLKHIALIFKMASSSAVFGFYKEISELFNVLLISLLGNEQQVETIKLGIQKLAMVIRSEPITYSILSSIGITTAPFIAWNKAKSDSAVEELRSLMFDGPKSSSQSYAKTAVHLPYKKKLDILMDMLEGSLNENTKRSSVLERNQE